MKARTFAWFVAPSVVLMMIFIAAPLISVFIQSFYLTQQVYEQVTVESCSPGFVTQTCITEVRSQPKLDGAGQPLTETAFVGLASYRALLQPETVAKAFSQAGGGFSEVLNIPFYQALRFT